MNERGFLIELDRVHHFLTLLRTEPNNDKAFQRCLAELDDYVMAQLNGDPYLEQFGDLAVLLDAHPDCAEAYALLHEMITADLTHTLVQPPTTPMPDLSFLREQTPTLLAQLTTAIQHTADSVILTLTEGLIALLRPLPAATPAFRTTQSGRYGQKLLQLEPDNAPPLHIPFSLSAYQDSQQLTHTLIEITVQPPHKSWPELAGYRVSLHYAEQSQQATTDAWGVASFLDIPATQLANLVVAVTLAA